MKFEDLGGIAGSAMHKQPGELTDEERVAIAVMAGCEYRILELEGRIETVNPVGFVNLTGRIEVREAIAKRGDLVRLPPTVPDSR